MGSYMGQKVMGSYMGQKVMGSYMGQRPWCAIALPFFLFYTGVC